MNDCGKCNPNGGWYCRDHWAVLPGSFRKELLNAKARGLPLPTPPYVPPTEDEEIELDEARPFASRFVCKDHYRPVTPAGKGCPECAARRRPRRRVAA